MTEQDEKNTKDFLNIDTSKHASKKENPFAKEEKAAAYKTIRIYEEDYKKLKELAFFSDRTIVECVHEAVTLLKKQSWPNVEVVFLWLIKKHDVLQCISLYCSCIERLV